MKTAYINGECFEVIHSKKTQNMIDGHLKGDYLGRRSLYDFYDNPSAIKEGIWSDWLKWYDDVFPIVTDMRVTGASCFSFSIGALYYNPDKRDELMGYIHITKDHNRLYLL